MSIVIQTREPLTSIRRWETLAAMRDPSHGVGAAFVGLLFATGCSASQPAIVDPQQPAAPAAKGQPLAASQIVICPEGSTYNVAQNNCLATTSVIASGPPTAASTAVASPQADSGVSVRCSFRNGWVSVMPVAAYPSDDSFLMQALIGLTEEPSFWTNQPEFAALGKYAARRCTDQETQFALPAGEYYVLAGEAGTFSRKGRYDRNGLRRRVRLAPQSAQSISIAPSDLTMTWNCISCPFVSFIDPSSGRLLPAFVVLANRNSPARRGTDRIEVRSVPVRNGRIRLRVAEVDHEISHLDQLVLEVDGRTVVPSRGGASSALARPDAVAVSLSRGTQILVDYDLGGVSDGSVDLVVVAHGYYEPTID